MVNGHVIPFTPIAVDFWKIRKSPSAKVFFLSHCHADHTEGLSSTWRKPIYCSEVTAKIAKLKLNVDEKMLRPLELNCSHIIGLDSESSETMNVMLIDANHCPGATMFVFQGYFGNILYTGDFRFHADMLTKTPLLKIGIDTLYLDNTYCSPSCEFPPREQCVERILNIVRESMDADRIVIGIRSFGKEDLLVQIAYSVNEWIGVSQNFYETAEVLNLPDVFNTDISNCHIKTHPLHMISSKCVKQWNEIQQTVIILPTALYHGIQGVPFSNLENVHIVPYSDHSSYSELTEFVSKIAPKRIIPIVSGRSRGPMGMLVQDRSDMSCFNQYMNLCKIHSFNIPESVKSFMSRGSSPVKTFRQTSRLRLLRPSRKPALKSKLGVNYTDSPEESKPDLNTRTGPLITNSCQKVLMKETKYELSDNKCIKDMGSCSSSAGLDQLAQVSQDCKNSVLDTDFGYPRILVKQYENSNLARDDAMCQVTVITLTVEDSESDSERDQNSSADTPGKELNIIQLHGDSTSADSCNSHEKLEQFFESVDNPPPVSLAKSNDLNYAIESVSLHRGHKAVMGKHQLCEEYNVKPLHKKRRRKLMQTY